MSKRIGSFWKYTFCFCAAFLFLLTSSYAQIVNIESQRIRSDTTGWFGNLGAAFSLTQNVSHILALDANAHVEYKTKKDLWLFLVNYDLLKTDTLQLNNNVFYHLRYNRTLNAWLKWEAFTQLQQNTLVGIGVRELAGTGPRFKLSGTKSLRLYAGTAVMYEYERDVSGPPVNHYDLRSDTYVSGTYTPQPYLTLVATVYYQPLFTRIADYRIANDLSLVIKLSKHFAMNTNWNFTYDTFPAYGVPTVTYTLSNGFTYSF